MRSKGVWEPPQIDHVGRVVAEERGDLGVAHVVGDGLGGVGRGAVDEDELASVVEREADDGREAGEARQDELPQLAPDVGEAADPGALVVAAGVEGGGVDHGQGPVADALGADRARLHEAAPRLQRLGARKAEVARHEELVVPAALGGGEHGGERVGVAVDVRDAEEPHRARIEGRGARRHGERAENERPADSR